MQLKVGYGINLRLSAADTHDIDLTYPYDARL